MDRFKHHYLWGALLLILLVAPSPEYPDLLVDNNVAISLDSINVEKQKSKVSLTHVRSLDELRWQAGFFENKGQLANNDIRFALRRPNIQVLLHENSFAYQLREEVQTDQGNRLLYHLISVNLLDANPSPEISWDEKSIDSHHYFKPGEPITDVHHFGRVTYHDIYPDIDLVFTARAGDERRPGAKYHFLVKPGGDPSKIKIRYNGQEELTVGTDAIQETSLASERYLKLSAGSIAFVEEMSEVFTVKNNVRNPTNAEFEVQADVVRYDIPNYNSLDTLVIDPDLVFLTVRNSTYFGTEGTDRMRDVATDVSGNVYVAGVSSGESVLLSTSGSYQVDQGGDNDMILAKFTPDLSTLLAASYYGGSGEEDAFGLDLDVDGNVYVAGYTASENFPIQGDSIMAQGEDMVVAQFNSDLSMLQWSQIISGSGDDRANQLDVANGVVAIVGTSSSTDLEVLSEDFHEGDTDAVIGLLNAVNGNLQWLQYFGDSRGDEGNGVVLGAETLYATGGIVENGRDDRAFVASYNLLGTPTESVTIGDFGLSANSIALNEDGSFLVVAGVVLDLNGGLSSTIHQSSYGGGPSDGFLARLDAADLSLDWSTFYGGDRADELLGVALDCNDNINAVGYSRSENNNNVIAFEGFINEFQGGGTNPEDRGDAILTKFLPNGQRYWGSYFGSDGDEEAIGLAFGLDGNIVMCGATTSESGITTEDVFDPTYNAQGKAGLVGFISAFCDVIITEDPRDQIAPVGGEAVFEVGMDLCGSVLSIQWFKDGLALADGPRISGSFTDSLSVSAITFDDAGEYCVRIQTTCGDEIERCGTLSIVELSGNNVCLDSATMLNNPSTSQDTIHLDFVDFNSNDNITNATYLWRVTASSGDVSGGNNVVGGSSGAFPITLPMTTGRPDLYSIDVLPTDFGTYTYELIFQYDDDRVSPTLVRDTVAVTVEVHPSPAISSIDQASAAFCENQSQSITLNSDIAVQRIIYERIDDNTTSLTGPARNEIVQEIATDRFEFTLSGFQNFTNTTQQATYRVVPFSEEGCVGLSGEVQVSVDPIPEFSVSLAQDTVCIGTEIQLDVEALVSPINYQERGGTAFVIRRRPNANILPAPTEDNEFVNSGSVNESLMNTSNEIVEVVYEIEALFNGCSVTTTTEVAIVPEVHLVHTTGNEIDVCSGESVNFELGTDVEGLSTLVEMSFEDNPNVSGERDTSFVIFAGEEVTLTNLFINTTNEIQTVVASINPMLFLGDAGTCGGELQEFTFNVTPLPELPSQTFEICAGDDFVNDLSELSSVEGSTFSWTATNMEGNATGFADGTGNIIDQTLNLISVEQSSVIYRITPSANACEGAITEWEVIVFAQPQITIGASPDNVLCFPDPSSVTLTASISNISSDMILGRQWFLGDSLLVGETNVDLETDVSGLYRHEVQSAGGCVVVDSITVNEVQRAIISIDAPAQNNTCSDQGLLLESITTGGGVDAYQWLLNGELLTGEVNESLNAVNEGNYQVIANPASACADTSDVATLAFFQQPIPVFDLPEEICALEVLDITGSNANDAVIDVIQWSVSGEDPLPMISDPTSFEATLSFGDNQETDRAYEVTLELTTDEGCRDVLTETIIQRARPLTNFDFVEDNCSGEITLASQSTVGATSFFWEALNNETAISISDPSDPDPIFEVNNNTGSALNFDIRLIAGNDNGCQDSLVQTLVVQPTPEIIITGAPAEICNGDGLVLSAEDSNPGEGLSFSSVRWFANGVALTSSLALDTTLTNEGVQDSLFQITFEGINEAGCANADTVEVIVHPDARAQINANTAMACAPFLIDETVIALRDFTDANTADYLWEVDSAGSIVATATGLIPPAYEITIPGITITYRLTAFSDFGCAEDTDLFTFNSFEGSEARFDVSSQGFCEDENAIFGNTSVNAASFFWDFGDGNTSVESSPQHPFVNPSLTRDTTYEVLLVAFTDNDCADSTTTTLTIHPLPMASFQLESICAEIP